MCFPNVGSLQSSFFAIAVITAISDDDMVEKIDAHQFACLADAVGELVILTAGTLAATGMVVAYGKNRSVAEQRVLDDDTYVDGGLRDAAVTDALFLDEFKRLVEHQNVELLHVEILQLGMHQVVDGCGGTEIGSLLGSRVFATLAEFTGGKDGDSLGRPHAMVAAQVVYSLLAQSIEIVIAVAEHCTHQVHGTLSVRSGANENGKQLGIAERRCSEAHHFLSRPVLLVPMINAEFFHP